MYSFRHFRPQAARVLFDDDTCCHLEIETNAGIDEFCQPFGASCQKKKKKKNSFGRQSSRRKEMLVTN